MNEATLRKRLHQEIRKRGGHAFAVESHHTGSGIPDTNYCIEGAHEWLELKYTASKKKGLRLRPAQSAWFKRRVKAGGKPMLLAQVDLQPRAYLLFGGPKVPSLAGVTSITAWLQMADVVWEDHLDWGVLIQILADPISDTTSPSP